MKDRLLVMLCLCMALCLVGCAGSHPEHPAKAVDAPLQAANPTEGEGMAERRSFVAAQLFGEAFRDQFNLTTLRRIGWIDMAAVGNALYRLMGNGDIYRYDAASGEYALYGTVPTPPEGAGAETVYSSLNDELKAALGKSVYRLFARDGGLCGYSSVSGAIGSIDEAGISWLDVRLDNAVQRAQDSAWPNPLQYLFSEGNALYAYYDRAWNEYGEQPCNGVMLAFDLDTGKCAMMDLPDTYMMCPYRTGYALLLRGDTGKGVYLSSLDLSTGAVADLDISIPFQLSAGACDNAWAFLEQVGGLAYDAGRQRIYLATPGTLYRADAGQDFRPCDIQGDLWDSLSGGAALILEDGSYFLDSTLVREA